MSIYIDPVRHGDHVVRLSEEHVSTPFPDELGDVGVHIRLENLQVHFWTRLRCHRSWTVIIDLDHSYLNIRHLIAQRTEVPPKSVSIPVWYGNQISLVSHLLDGFSTKPSTMSDGEDGRSSLFVRTDVSD
jgi:hypothetical protein